MDEVAGDKQLRLNFLPDAVAFDARFQRKPLFQQRDGVVGFEFLPEADSIIDEQHQQNDGLRHMRIDLATGAFEPRIGNDFSVACAQWGSDATIGR